jgi:hypothetical protein
MQSKTGDPRLDALDEIRAAMGEIYNTKRAHTATPADDARLKKLHTQWMAVMQKLGSSLATEAPHARHPRSFK